MCRHHHLICPLYFIVASPPNIHTLSLHDALPIWPSSSMSTTRTNEHAHLVRFVRFVRLDRKSTRLNSSHTVTSYAVFCLKKKHKIVRSNATYPFDRAGRLAPRRLYGPTCVSVLSE